MASAAPRVHLSSGSVVGDSVGTLDRYLGIPYAAPPFGENRFRMPQPPAPWTGERDATAFGPAAPQSPYPGAIGQLLPSLTADGSDPDILTVNVWTPHGAAGLPVVLWIHGGALERGGSSIPLYDGTPFARDGIVYVSVNYRLGSEGFSVLEGAPRNLGLEDVAAALRWVHAEIAAFGGDPARITAMGESAGGALVAALAARPDSRELLAGAIVQSGPLDAQPAERAGRVTRALAQRLGIPATRDAFAAVSPAALLAARDAQAAGSSLFRSAPSFGLTLDPQSLPRAAVDALPDAALPVLIGSNTDEYRLWLAPEALAKVHGLTAWVARRALKLSGPITRAYRDDLPTATAGELVGQGLTDSLLRAPMVQAARTRQHPTYVYEFAWPSPVRGLGAAHALEIGFVFADLHSDDSVRMAGTEAPQSLADEMHAAWVRMITAGDPGWPAFAGTGPVRIFDETPSTASLPRARGLAALIASQQRRAGRSRSGQ